MWKLLIHSVIWKYSEMYGMIVNVKDRKVLIQSVESWYNKNHGKNMFFTVVELLKRSVAS